MNEMNVSSPRDGWVPDSLVTPPPRGVYARLKNATIDDGIIALRSIHTAARKSLAYNSEKFPPAGNSRMIRHRANCDQGLVA